MKNTPKYYIVEASALPEVFLKVAEAKRLLATGQAATVNEATKITGISRSYVSRIEKRALTKLRAVLEGEQGVFFD